MAFAEFLTADIYWYDPAMPHPPIIGRQAVMDYVSSVLAAFPDFAYSLRGQICVTADDTACALPFRITCTHTGVLSPPGFAPTLRTVSFVGIDFLHFRGELIDRIETYFDPIPAVEQLTGMVLRPASGSFSERCLVFAQRVVAAWARRHPNGSSQRP